MTRISLNIILIFCFISLSYSDEFENLNSNAFELSPIIVPDGSRIWFTRESHPENINHKVDPYSQDIWFSDFENGRWKEPTHGGTVINNEGFNRVISCSADGKRIFLSGNYLDEGWVSEGISFSDFKNGKWTKPDKIEITEFTNYSNYIDYYISVNGNILIISATTNTTFGKRDLYISKYLDGKWSSPVNLGETVNSSNEDFSPYLAPDNKTLYFASNRSGGKGDSDIWVTKRLDEDFTSWTEPINLGQNINTEGWDAYFSIKANSDEAVIVRVVDKLNGNTDIKKIELSDTVKPSKVIVLKGKIIDESTNMGLKSDLVVENLDKSKILREITSNDNGEFEIIIDEISKIGLSANKDNYYPISENLDVEDFGNHIYKVIKMKKIEIGQSIRLNNIFFRTGEAELLDKSFIELNRVADLLSNNPNMKILIKGYTDNIGTPINNQKLSENRAKSVADYLINMGYELSRVDFKGFGEENPIKDNSTEEGRAYNRRVEFEIIEN